MVIEVRVYSWPPTGDSKRGGPDRRRVGGWELEKGQGGMEKEIGLPVEGQGRLKRPAKGTDPINDMKTADAVGGGGKRLRSLQTQPPNCVLVGKREN